MIHLKDNSMKKIMCLILIAMSMTTLQGCQTEKNNVTIYFELNGGSGIENVNVDKHHVFEYLPTPTYEGHTFIGWYVDVSLQEVFTEDSIINDQMTLYAKWSLDVLSYTNPIYEGGTGADPHIIQYEDAFYIYVTGGVLLKSNDMISWENLGTVIDQPTWGTLNANIWAPDIVKINDKFLLYYSLSTWGDPNPGIGIASADHPEGPWTDHGKLFNSKEIGVNNSIDPTVFIGQDNHVYMIWGSMRGNYGVELSEDGLQLLNGLSYAVEHKVHIAGYDTSTPWAGDTYEGQYVIFKDGYYYLFLSSGSCCEGLNSNYHVRVSRSKNPLGPYIDDQGQDVLSGYRGKIVVQSSSRIIGPGHNSIIIDDAGTYWMIYHAYKTIDGITHQGRQVMMDPLIWSEDGWPTIRNLMPTYQPQEGPIFN